MPASRKLSWSELRVGLFVLMALGMASVFVFYLTQAGAFFTREVRYVTYLPDAAGLELTRGMKGAPVPAGGEVHGSQRGSVKQIVDNVERLTAEMRQLIADIRKDPKKYLNAKISLF